ncbi:YcjF family protein [Aestuariivirga sp.]|uniref:YcjF family protein n=1 Tax=Aestuariivirga sp. TaxID=2650926 RepID=UPI0025B900DF|nr:TIGR01620 family protein [Aestuariivirga sp.]MCA3554639.1 TIGR01620 family protein [Aestuariivirga sp.]
MSEHRNPRAFVFDKPEPEDEPRRNPRAITGIAFEPETDGGGPIVTPPAWSRPSRFRWGALLASALFALVAMGAGLSISKLVEDFFARSPILGWTALGAAAIAASAALVIILREIWALARLRRIEHIQADAARAINTDDSAAAERAVDKLKSLYAGRPDAQLGLREMKRHEGDILDGRDRIRLAERHLVDWRDAEAHRIIAHAARRITLLTTVAPTAALDILLVAAQNLRMMRDLAALYGGRPSTFSTLRLARMVISHLALTGGIALSDNLIQHVVGRGLLGRLSARFGEGTVNGILTARVGLAARDVCRPIPQETAAKDTLGSLMKELVSSAPREKDN